jgi:hypothetical protein
MPLPETDDSAGELGYTFFNPNRGFVGSDGVLRVPMGGSSPQGIWDGQLALDPSHDDFEFWTWMIQKWPYSSSMSAEDLPLLKAEFQKTKEERLEQ